LSFCNPPPKKKNKGQRFSNNAQTFHIKNGENILQNISLKNLVLVNKSKASLPFPVMHFRTGETMEEQNIFQPTPSDTGRGTQKPKTKWCSNHLPLATMQALQQDLQLYAW
jgi:hypothetical protein